MPHVCKSDLSIMCINEMDWCVFQAGPHTGTVYLKTDSAETAG